MAKLLKTLEVYRDEVWCHDINLYEITSWLSPKGSKKHQMGRKLPCMLDSSSCKISFFAPSFSMRGISIRDRQLVLITSILRCLMFFFTCTYFICPVVYIPCQTYAYFITIDLVVSEFTIMATR
jgi:hypothetical protein